MKKRIVAMLMSFVLAASVMPQGRAEVVFAGTYVDMEHATSVTVGKSVSGTISTEGEDAYYKFTTGNANAYYTVTASTSTADKSFSVDLLDSDGGSIESMDFSTEESGTLTYKLEPQKTYYLNVVMYDTEVSGKFSLKVTQTLDDYDDTMEKAAEVQLNKVNSGVFEAAADQDYMQSDRDWNS